MCDQGIDPNLAFMGVIALSMFGVWVAVHVLRDILEKLLAAQRAGDAAMVEYRQQWSDYEYRLAQYYRAQEQTEWKHDVRPSPPPEKVTVAKKRGTGPIEWTG